MKFFLQLLVIATCVVANPATRSMVCGQIATKAPNEAVVLSVNDVKGLPTRIAFGSCGHQTKPQPILNTVIESSPDLFIYLGDNIYGDTKDMKVLKQKYELLGSKPEFQKLRASTTVLSVWDDHDYGWNDAGKEYPFKAESKEIFMDFWRVPKNSDRRQHQGIYGEHRFTENGKTLQIILLDTRTFRDSLKRNPKPIPKGSSLKNQYQPDPSPEKTLLGSEQWNWLEETLKQPADLRIICSSIQFGHEYNGWESWTNLPTEQKKLVELIRSTGANGVVFISGDVHWGEISKRPFPGCYDLYDVTSSGLTEKWYNTEPNRYRVGEVYRKNHFGLIEIDWKPDNPTVNLSIVGLEGKAVAQHQFQLSELTFPKKAEQNTQTKNEKPNSPVLLDLDDHAFRQTVVDYEANQYLGHPTTCLLEDGKTILTVYPKGHGKGGIVYKKSVDGGLTWSERLATPKNWESSQEVPTLHRVEGPDGTKRLIMWSGLYPARLAVSEDDGDNWSELKPVGDWGGIVVMGFVEKVNTGPGHYLAMFHDNGMYIRGGDQKSPRGGPAGKRTNTMTLYTTKSTDGGLTWSDPQAIFAASDVHLCEPGCIRSPDGKRLAVLLRENARNKNSHIIFSDDEGQTWTAPKELPLSLTGDRHTGKYGPDGRLMISFRCRSPKSKSKIRPFEGDWVGWVGTWEDLVEGNEGQYFVRIKDNKRSYDTAYPGVEILPDGTFVATTYGHWTKGMPPYILSSRFKLSEIDELAKPN